MNVDVKIFYASVQEFSEQKAQTDFSRLEALVKERESLLKFIYERRKGEVPPEPTLNRIRQPIQTRHERRRYATSWGLIRRMVEAKKPVMERNTQKGGRVGKPSSWPFQSQTKIKKKITKTAMSKKSFDMSTDLLKHTVCTFYCNLCAK